MEPPLRSGDFVHYGKIIPCYMAFYQVLCLRISVPDAARWRIRYGMGVLQQVVSAGSTNSVDVYYHAAAQIKKALDMAVKLHSVMAADCGTLQAAH
jgi:hypothetical protein